MYSEGIGNSILEGVVAFVFIVALVILATIGFISIIKDNTIRTNTPLTPELEITVKEGVVDTVYIYKIEK